MFFTHPEIPEPLKITISLDLPSDDIHDEISLQILQSLDRKFQIVGVYTESHRGEFGKDSWEHKGYIVDKKLLIKIEKYLEKYANKKISRKNRVYKKIMKLYKNVMQYKGYFLQKGDNVLPDFLL